MAEINNIGHLEKMMDEATEVQIRRLEKRIEDLERQVRELNIKTDPRKMSEAIARVH